MPRFELVDDSITVSYGYEDACNVFLSVSDKRLRYDASASPAVNDVTRGVGCGDGDGCFFEQRYADEEARKIIALETLPPIRPKQSSHLTTPWILRFIGNFCMFCLPEAW